jgi:hypothetical protein
MFHETLCRSDSLGSPMKNTLCKTVQTGAKLVRPITNQLLYQLSYAGKNATLDHRLRYWRDPKLTRLRSWRL